MGHMRRMYRSVVDEKFDRRGELLCRFRRAEGEEWVSGSALEEVEGAAVALWIERVWKRDVHVPPFTREGHVVGSRRGRCSVAFVVEARPRGCCAVEDGSAPVVCVRVHGVVFDATDKVREGGKARWVPHVEGGADNIGFAP